MNTMKKLLTLLCAFLAMASAISAQETEPDYLCFEVEAGTTIGLKMEDGYHRTGYTNRIKSDINVFYSFDKTNWTRLWANGEIKVASDCFVYFKGTNTCFFKFEESNNSLYSAKFVVSKPFKCSGNIMTLIDEFGMTTALEDDYAFAYVFAGCPMVTAPKLPAQTLSNYCYSHMFSACQSLTTAPNLLATNLTIGCYSYMFSLCESLTTAPELPSNNLADDCYSGMFSNCSNLTVAPRLPGTNLAGGCYSSMFSNCRNLTIAPNLPATLMADNCYSNMFAYCVNLKIAPELPAITLANDCYQGMFRGCTNLKTTPVLPAVELKAHCYNSMFQDCYNIEKASPILFEKEDIFSDPTSYCSSMFSNCSKLKYISVRFSSWLPNWGTYKQYPAFYEWVKNVSSTGTFVQPPRLNTIRGDSYIPEGWKLKILDMSSGDETSGNETIGYFIRVAESSKDYITTSETMEIEAGSKIYVAVIDRTSEGY
ncbi:MAG: hypothetical protein IKO56_07210, partial [Alphaproteobacteria bacterium]|nr:hypothetical protein [Alphaproteobacteria bacterium]